jgi:leader peptidase (prepilin peptidase) / N-methyltransferase
VTAWGVVAVCALGGGAAGPVLDAAARRTRPKSTVAAGVPAPAGTDLPPAARADPAAPAPAAPPAGTTPVRSGEVVSAAVVTAALWAVAAVRVGAVPQLAAYCVLIGGLVAVSITDLRTNLVPRKLVYPALGLLAVALLSASAVQHDWRAMIDAVVGGAAGFAVFVAIWWVYPRGMGFGDVRLAGLCGTGLGWLGFRELYLGFLAAFVLGAVMGLVVLALRGTRRFPFAPAMAAGTVVGVLWGGWLGNLWMHPG